MARGILRLGPLRDRAKAVDPDKVEGRTLLNKLYDYLATPEWEKRVAGLLVLLLAPVGLAAMALGPRFQGLQSLAALDHAQLGRNILDGQGFATSVIRPLSLVFHADLKAHPDLYNAPVHPLLLGLWFCLLHPSDRITGAFGAGVWILSVWLTFWVASRWFGGRTATLAAFLYGCNTAALLAAAGGLPYPLAAVGILAAVWLVAPKPEPPPPATAVGTDAVPAPPDTLGAPRLWGAGAVSALVVLTHYTLAVLPLSLALYLGLTQKRPARALGLFAMGFFAVLLPWMVRSLVLAGSPFFSLFWYEALTDTRSYPGGSIWRTMGASTPSPLLFVLGHPLEMLRKAASGASQLRVDSLNVTDPIIGFLFLAALLGGGGGWKWRRLMASVAGGVLLCLAASSILRPEPSLLLAWTPLLAIAGASHCIEWLTANTGRISLGRLRVRRAWVLSGAYLALIVAAAFPSLHYVAFGPSAKESAWDARALPLRRLLPPKASVMTDQPVQVAWYGARRAVWLCQEESGFDTLQSALGPVDASYLTTGLAMMPPDEKAPWWTWLAAPVGEYRGLVPSEFALPDALLRVRRK